MLYSGLPINQATLGTSQSVLIRGMASFQGSRLEGVHCITILVYLFQDYICLFPQEDCLEVKKDTERADQLKSMVQAWETEQPGRCKKAQESRQKFLDARAIREEKANDDDFASTSTLDSPHPQPQPNTGPVKIWQMDLTPFTM